MPSPIERGRERWERMNSRERKLTVALALTFVVCIVAWLAFMARDHMADIESKNKTSRKALRALAQHRAGAARQSSADKVEIPESPVALDSYLEEIIGELELESPTYPAPKSSEKGSFVEWSFRVELKELSIEEVAEFLEKLETRSAVVVVKELTIDTSFKDKEKLDLELVVATYSEKPDESAAGDGEDAADGEEDES